MTLASRPAILWFRDDLRLQDHPALLAAASDGPLICVFVHDDAGRAGRPLGGAARWWLHHSLESLRKELNDRGGRLDLLAGEPRSLLPELAAAADARAVFCSRRYGRAAGEVDRRIATELEKQSVPLRCCEGTLLHDPGALKTQAGDFYRVFTPFWRALRERLGEGLAPHRDPARVNAAPWPREAPRRVSLDELDLLPTKPDWAGGLRQAWSPGEPHAHARLLAFLEDESPRYASERDSPALEATSRLSPHLRFGELSPRQVWRAAAHASDAGTANSSCIQKFLSELAWREFSYHLLHHAPDLATANFNRSFDGFPWRPSASREAESWRRGLTGYPLVDAGMRELWRTGYMHNRVRLIVASFLVKDLLIDWRVGEAWFWDTLCDADPANNAANWQWCAGSGADAAPYFRIFNPVLQSRKFDPTGAYIRKHVPELAALPNEWIHDPSACPPGLLALAGVELGKTYPRAIVEHGLARERALAALRATKRR